MTESKVDVLGVLDAAAASFDNIRFERRDDPNAGRLDVYWSTRIGEVHAARAAVENLIKAARKAMNNIHVVPGTSMDAVVGPTFTVYGIFLNDLRAALAACTPAKSEGR